MADTADNSNIPQLSECGPNFELWRTQLINAVTALHPVALQVLQQGNSGTPSYDPNDPQWKQAELYPLNVDLRAYDGDELDRRMKINSYLLKVNQATEAKQEKAMKAHDDWVALDARIKSMILVSVKDNIAQTHLSPLGSAKVYYDCLVKLYKKKSADYERAVADLVGNRGF